jgi:hypothetical protein
MSLLATNVKVRPSVVDARLTPTSSGTISWARATWPCKAVATSSDAPVDN